MGPLLVCTRPFPARRWALQRTSIQGPCSYTGGGPGGGHGGWGGRACLSLVSRPPPRALSGRFGTQWNLTFMRF